MPRREQIDGKKKERLMQENDVLQKLMLQSKSSIRPSSLRNRTAISDGVWQEESSTETEGDQERAGAIRPDDEVTQVEVTIPAEKPEIKTVREERKSATEKPHEQRTTLLPEENRTAAAGALSSKSQTINVIMPEQNSAPSVPKPEVKPAEPFRRPHNALIVDKDMFLKEEVKPVVPVRSAGRGAKRAIPKSKPAKVLSYALLLLMGLLVGFGGYYFYAKYGSRSARTGTNRNAEVATAPVPQTEVEAGDETTAEGQLDTEPSEPKNTRATNETAGNESEEAPAQPIATPPASTSTTAEAPETTTTLGRYKVISKAYFHNEPDEDTRRKAFIIHWNNAVLMPVEEKNGFMYVEFTNHLGQTSKGWLLKKDLQKLN